MPRPALSSSSLEEGIHSYDRLLADAARDGVIDAEELRRLVRAFRPLVKKCQRLHESLRFVDMAIHGDGIYGDWFERMRKEEVKSRTHLRLVAAHDDGPRPSGPAAQKKAA